MKNKLRDNVPYKVILDSMPGMAFIYNRDGELIAWGKNVCNITDGFEGDEVTDTESLFIGQRMVNGWKNAGCPWTYSINPKLMLIPESK